MKTSKATYEICAEGIDSSNKVKALAARHGVSEQTVRAWRFPKASDADPDGHGKGNPLDQAARYIEGIHVYNPGNAREAADHFAEMVDQLDEASGLTEAEAGADVLDRLAKAAEEHTDVVVLLCRGRLDQRTLQRGLTEISEAQCALAALTSAIRSKLNRSNVEAIEERQRA